MMTPDHSAPATEFNVLVESASRTEDVFPPPTGWTSQVLNVEPLTFRSHVNPSNFFATNERQAPSILTVPDIAMSDSAFSTFFNYCRRSEVCPQLDLSSTHYHACLPGHQLDAPNLPSSTDISMSAVVEAITKLIRQHEISRVVGIGIGYGAAALLRAAAKLTNHFSGLVLISPVIEASPLSDRVIETTETVLTRQLGFGLSRRTKDRLLARWLSNIMVEENYSPGISIEEELDRRNPNNVLRMISEDTWRQDASTVIKDITARVLLVTGKGSSLRYHAENYISAFDPENVSRLDIVDTGSLVHDEQPERVAKALSLFLQGIAGFN